MGVATIVQVVSSLPAMYALAFLDGKTYDRIHDALEDDEDAPLLAYPSVDYSDEALRADAYGPTTFGKYVRYPDQKATGFSATELANGYAVFKTLSDPMDPALSQKFFNLRGVQTRSGGGARENTMGSLYWDWIEADYDVYRDRCPIKRKPFGRNDMCGDGVIPAWSARLLRDDDAERESHVITVDIGRHEHMFIMESSRVQDAIGGILGVAAGPVPKRKAVDPPKMASEEDALDFVKDLHHYFVEVGGGPMLVSDSMIQEYLRKTGVSKAQQLSLARRIYVMLHKPVVD
jgi:hypothetical protein